MKEAAGIQSLGDLVDSLCSMAPDFKEVTDMGELTLDHKDYMIRDYHHYHTGLLRVMQRLCWARLLQRNASFVPLSLGSESPAFCISYPPPPSSIDNGVAVYDPLVIRIIQGMLPQPSHKALSRHLQGLRHQTYRDTLPSFQAFT